MKYSIRKGRGLHPNDPDPRMKTLSLFARFSHAVFEVERQTGVYRHINYPIARIPILEKGEQDEL